MKFCYLFEVNISYFSRLWFTDKDSIPETYLWLILLINLIFTIVYLSWKESFCNQMVTWISPRGSSVSISKTSLLIPMSPSLTYKLNLLGYCNQITDTLEYQDGTSSIWVSRMIITFFVYSSICSCYLGSSKLHWCWCRGVCVTCCAPYCVFHGRQIGRINVVPQLKRGDVAVKRVCVIV